MAAVSSVKYDCLELNLNILESAVFNTSTARRLILKVTVSKPFFFSIKVFLRFFSGEQYVTLYQSEDIK